MVILKASENICRLCSLLGCIKNSCAKIKIFFVGLLYPQFFQFAKCLADFFQLFGDIFITVYFLNDSNGLGCVFWSYFCLGDLRRLFFYFGPWQSFRCFLRSCVRPFGSQFVAILYQLA